MTTTALDARSSDGATGRHRRASPARPSTVLDGGPFTTVQDLPGRVGFWHVGVPPERADGRPLAPARQPRSSATPTSRAGARADAGRARRCASRADAVVALGGAPMPMTVDGRAGRRRGRRSRSPAGAIVRVGALSGPGMRATLAVARWVSTAASYLGSRSTFTLGGFGGHEGGRSRPATCSADRRRRRPRPPPGRSPPGLAPDARHHWELGVLSARTPRPSSSRRPGSTPARAPTWRGALQLGAHRGAPRRPAAAWARPDGGEAGLHPSNIHDTGYAIGAVDLTGDMPVILGPDGPSLGGFVCPAVVAAGRALEARPARARRPGAARRAGPPTAAAGADGQRREWLERATAPIEPVARPPWNRPLASDADARPPGATVTRRARRAPDGDHPAVTYRRAGDRFLLVEYGAMALDLDAARSACTPSTGGSASTSAPASSTPPPASARCSSRSTASELTVESARVGARARGRGPSSADVVDAPFPSRIVHLPLSWDDPATREAIERYMHGVRADAPWCPWNIEFIRRINGLDDRRRRPPHRVRRVVPRARPRRRVPRRAGRHAARSPPPPRHDQVQPGADVDARERRRHRRRLPLHLRHGGPGGYQFVGRTVQVWNRAPPRPALRPSRGCCAPFDQLRWFTRRGRRAARHAGARRPPASCALRIEPTTFRLAEHRRFLADHADEIADVPRPPAGGVRRAERRWPGSRAGEYGASG